MRFLAVILLFVSTQGFALTQDEIRCYDRCMSEWNDARLCTAECVQNVDSMGLQLLVDDQEYPDYMQVHSNVLFHYQRGLEWVEVLVEPVGNFDGGYIFDVYVRDMNPELSYITHTEYKTTTNYYGYVLEDEIVRTYTEPKPVLDPVINY